MGDRKEKSVLVMTDFKVAGGAKSAFFLLTSFFVDRGFPVSVWLIDREVAMEEDLAWFSERNISIKYLPRFFQRKTGWILRLRLQGLFQFLFFLTYRGSYARVVASIQKPYDFLPAAWVWGRKLVYYQFGVPQGKPSRLSRLLQPWRKAYYRFLSSTGFCYITGSEGSKLGLWAPFNLTERQLPIQVLPLPGRFDPQEILLNSNRAVFTLGHVEKWKGPEFWLQVAIACCEEESDIRFIWGGFGSLKEKLEAEIPKEYQDRIRFIGPVEKLEEQFRETAVYFQPSFSESQGLAVMEAMAFGLPCVVTRVGGLPDLVEEGVSGHIVSTDAGEAKGKILSLLNRPEVRFSMGKAGNKRYSKDFSQETWSNRLNELVFGSAR